MDLINKDADYLRNLVVWMDHRNEELNDGKTAKDLMDEFDKTSDAYKNHLFSEMEILTFPTLKDWRIEEDDMNGYSVWHDDYDGAPDSGDFRCRTLETRLECIQFAVNHEVNK